MSELERLRWRVTTLEDNLYYQLKQKERELQSQIEDVKGSFVDYYEFSEWCERLEKLEARLAEIERLVKGEKGSESEAQ
jgi:BMFP domain-containing protein YqiC